MRRCPSNFTARVLQAPSGKPPRSCAGRGWKWGGWPRSALAAQGGFGGQSWLAREWSPACVIQDAQRKILAESVAVVSAVSSVPGPDVLKDFDAIRASNPTPAADEQLLTALQ